MAFTSQGNLLLHTSKLRIPTHPSNSNLKEGLSGGYLGSLKEMDLSLVNREGALNSGGWGITTIAATLIRRGCKIGKHY